MTMATIAIAGESGEITEIVQIGPAHLVRHRTWYGLDPLVQALAGRGFEVTTIRPGPVLDPIPHPDVWIISDLPLISAAAFGILDVLAADVPGRSGLIAIGGAFSFAGLNAAGGWQDPRGASLLPVAMWPFADATERPAGVRLIPTPECHEELGRLLTEAPPFFGYNLVEPLETATVLAKFDDGAPALIVSRANPNRSIAFTSDLLPHWAPDAVRWNGLPAFLQALYDLARSTG
jgi:uncharacterized membrane protein